MVYDLVITGGLLVDPQWGEVRGTLAIRDGSIAAILSAGETVEATETIEANGLAVLPGAIDPHTHLGFAGDFASDIATETDSAALGGVTTVMSFHRQYQGRRPEPYDELPGLIRAIDETARVDVALHFGMLAESQVREIPKYTRAGVSSYKFYMAYRGADGATVGMVNECDDGLLLEGLGLVAEAGGVACIHAENTDIVNRAMPAVRASGAEGLAAWSAARPAFAEVENIQRVTLFGEHVGASIYLVHIGSAESLAAARAAKTSCSTPVWIETCSHYLTHTVDSPVGSLAKINPPLRTEADLESLWQGIADGTVDTVGTDHCAVPLERKQSSIWTAAAGFPGTATLLPVLLSEGHHKRGVSLQRIAGLLAGNPARIFGLPGKGSLKPGSDADLVLVDLDREVTVDHTRLGSVSDYSILDGQVLTGWPVRTIVAGRTVMLDGQLGEDRPGRFVAH